MRFQGSPELLYEAEGPRVARSLGLRIFGFRISDFGFRVSGLGSRDSSFGFGVSDFGSRISGCSFRVLSLRFRVAGFGFRVLGFGFQGWRFQGPCIGYLVQLLHEADGARAFFFFLSLSLSSVARARVRALSLPDSLGWKGKEIPELLHKAELNPHQSLSRPGWLPDVKRANPGEREGKS